LADDFLAVEDLDGVARLDEDGLVLVRDITDFPLGRLDGAFPALDLEIYSNIFPMPGLELIDLPLL
jgi:aspartokinase-like uncharacterized kinase